VAQHVNLGLVPGDKMAGHPNQSLLNCLGAMHIVDGQTEMVGFNQKPSRRVGRKPDWQARVKEITPLSRP